jgi:acetyl-CoA synthetase
MTEKKNDGSSNEYELLADKLVERARQEAAKTKIGNNGTATGVASAPSPSPSTVWSYLHPKLSPNIPFEVHQLCYTKVYDGIEDVKPAWLPNSSDDSSNITKMMKSKGFESYTDFYNWSINKDTRDDFWMESQAQIGIVWDVQPSSAFSTTNATTNSDTDVEYFPNGKLNISDSCFNKRRPDETAVVYSMESHPRSLRTMSFGQLDTLSNQIANALTYKLNLREGDTVGICMPMTPESIAIYLGIVKAGCAVVSIADSFSAEEIATRCRLGQAKVVFTQDVIFRGSKFLPLFGRVLDAAQRLEGESITDDAKETKLEYNETPSSSSLNIVVIPGMLHATEYPNDDGDNNNNKGSWTDRRNGQALDLHESAVSVMRPGHDASWYDLLDGCSEEFTSVKRSSMAPCNILFSSGTTGEPKAIVWSQSTPIKSAVDGYYHQDIHVGETIAWPTNIGWMMGPWLLFQLINGATIGLFNGIASTCAFCEFVDEADVSMLGVVPSLVKAWRAKNAIDDCDWNKIRRFSSTGEASDPETYLYLMSRVEGYSPVIEYCGGTEIGGSFLSSTVVQPNVPSMFSSPVLGSQIMLMDVDGKVMEESSFYPANDSSVSGELAIVPPSVGLSTTLLNRCHHTVYFKGMPCGPQGETLRRHGDEVECVRSSEHLDDTEITTTPYFRALGRCDDTMNIGGIKVASVEIERVCNLVDGVHETAAIAVSGSKGGPSKLGT